MDEPKSHWIPCEKPHNIPAKGLTPKMVAAELQGICAERAAAAHAKLSRPSPSLNDIYASITSDNRDEMQKKLGKSRDLLQEMQELINVNTITARDAIRAIENERDVKNARIRNAMMEYEGDMMLSLIHI